MYLATGTEICMRGKGAPEFQLVPEIEKTTRSLRKQGKENCAREQQFDLGFMANVFLEDEDQPDMIEMAIDKERSIRDYVVFDPRTMSTGIVRP